MYGGMVVLSVAIAFMTFRRAKPISAIASHTLASTLIISLASSSFACLSLSAFSLSNLCASISIL